MQTTDNKGGAFLSLRHLEKVYPNGEKAVYDFNLDIDKNEFIVVVGPSGCGKSTTLRMIAGLEDISEGDIFLEGELLNYKPSKDRGMAIVFQSYALYPQMSVFDNIAFPLTINKFPMPVTDGTLAACRELEVLFDTVPADRIGDAARDAAEARGGRKAREEALATMLGLGLPAAEQLYGKFVSLRQSGAPFSAETVKSWREEIAARAAEAETAVAARGARVDETGRELNTDGSVRMEARKLTPYEIRQRVYDTAEKLDLTPYLDKLPKELSGGQMQRVALGRAIIKNVPIFLMDEPLSNLDAKLRLTMRSEIVKLHNRINATTIYVTHDQTEAMTMATRIVVMSKGFIQQISTPEEVYNNPQNLFVARFMGSPSMNIFDMRYDGDTGTLTCGDLKVEMGGDFTARHDAFYADKVARFNHFSETFGRAEQEEIRKILSVTGENADPRPQVKRGNSLFGALRYLRRKKRAAAPEDEFAFEKGVAADKREKLAGFRAGPHSLVVGIRPEKIRLEKRVPGKKYKDAFIVKPTVCELLGGEYNVHFDFAGRDMVGQIAAGEKISPQDEIAVRFPAADMYVFDPITGDRIR